MIIIAGPCLAESREIVFETAEYLSKISQRDTAYCQSHIENLYNNPMGFSTFLMVP